VGARLDGTRRAVDRADRRIFRRHEAALNLACAVLHGPELLLLDEPTTGVDPQSRERIFAMLAELRRDGTALLHTTHQLGEAEGVCDRVVIIDHGHVVAEGTPAALIERTLGRAHEVVITLDRVADRLPGRHARGRPHGARRRRRSRERPAGAPRAAPCGGLRGADVRVDRADLHAVFLHLTGRELRE
jgi:ABC-2 type transport system ATP-binding protein